MTELTLQQHADRIFKDLEKYGKWEMSAVDPGDSWSWDKALEETMMRHVKEIVPDLADYRPFLIIWHLQDEDIVGSYVLSQNHVTREFKSILVLDDSSLPSVLEGESRSGVLFLNDSTDQADAFHSALVFIHDMFTDFYSKFEKEAPSTQTLH